MKDQEKSEMGTKTFVGFCQQFGDDIYAQILLEELFKGLIDEEALFVFGEQIETGGDQVNNSSSERVDSDIKAGGCDGIESATDLAEENFTDHP